jgi:exopolyphosphatase/guanosine-5'-triphosphate,3'-diphosphate pyrophosphatase
MRVAVLDCGTNTFNLLLVETSKEGFSVVHSAKIPVKLGEGAINTGFIAAVPFARGIDALKEYGKLLKETEVERVFVFATSAIRDASNGIDFVREAFLQSGIKIEVIDGDREAELIYKGNRLALDLGNNPCLIMDIGGGSTEFIIGNKHKIYWKKSYRLGAARLLEAFKPSDPISEVEIRKMNSYLFDTLSDLEEAVRTFKPYELIGSSGAFDSVVEMIHGELNGEPFLKNKTEYLISLPDYFMISEKVIKSKMDERRQIKGLVEMRVDMMVISCLLMNYVLINFKLSKFRVSAYSLKEGALYELIYNHSL